MAMVAIRCWIDPSQSGWGSSTRTSWKTRFASIPRAWGLLFIAIVVMGAFLFHVNISSNLHAQSEEELVKQFHRARQRYINGQYINSKVRIERIISIILETNVDRNDILGQCYLLLGAIYEKEGKPILAKENYSKAKDKYNITSVEDVDLCSLPLYRKLVKCEELPAKGTIELTTM